MTCKTANYLRLAWYRTAHNLTKQPGYTPAQLTADHRHTILADRDNPEYQAAKAAYLNHLATCELCRKQY